MTSEANPPVESYRLHAYRIGSNVSKIGTWNEEVSREGEHVYNCLAQHKLGTVNSSNVIVTFNGECRRSDRGHFSLFSATVLQIHHQTHRMFVNDTDKQLDQ